MKSAPERADRVYAAPGEGRTRSAAGLAETHRPLLGGCGAAQWPKTIAATDGEGTALLAVSCPGEADDG